MQHEIRPVAGRAFAIEGSFFEMNAMTGIARVWRQIFSVWQQNGFLERIVLFDRNGTMPKDIGPVRRVILPPHDYSDLSYDPALLQKHCDELDVAAFCSTYYAYPETTPALAVVHDMIPEIRGYKPGSAIWAEKHNLLRRAEYFVCVSENTKKDLLRFFPQVEKHPVVVGRNGVTTLPVDPDYAKETAHSAFGIDREYVLFIGGSLHYKGLPILAEALACIPKAQRPLLVVVSQTKDVFPEVVDLLGEENIRSIYVTDQGLRILYEGALAYINPSFYEGFGLTLLEAMSCGCPVISSDGGALPEVAGDAAWLVPVGGVEPLVEAIEMLRDTRIRNQLIMRGYRRIEGFSWTEIANAVQQGLLTLAGEA